MTQTCPSCAQPAAGRFCSNCGTRISAPETCAECAAELLPGARFCNMCGASVAASSATPQPAAMAGGGGGEGGQWRDASRLPWYVAGLALVALTTVVLVFGFRSEQTPAPLSFVPAPAASTGDARAIDLSSMTPREAADRLFDRIMRSVSAGDTAQARTFLPMAFGAYERVEDLDADARYHLGVMHLLDGDPAAARAEADAILAADPTHLFGLITAAQAERDLGNAAGAGEHYRRFLEVYAAEIERNLPEYQAHMPALPQMRAEAQAFAASGR